MSIRKWKAPSSSNRHPPSDLSAGPAGGQKHRHKRGHKVVALVVVTVAAGVGVVLLTRGGGGSEASIGRPAPAIDLPDVRSSHPQVVLAELRGTPVLVNFWATWCVPCRTEMPLLAAADDRLDGKVAIVGVDVKDNRDAAAAFLAERNVDYPSAYDPDEVLSDPYDLVGLPVTVLVGRDGRIVERVTGAVTRSRLDGLLTRAQAPE
jgi:cytochrome c biogenesis protein CcmG/thiol:disulfide interchange protein DsbE